MPDAPDQSPPPYTIDWHRGARGALRALFELAEDSPDRLDATIDLGRVLVATDATGDVIGHLQLVPTTQAHVAEIATLAVHPDRQRRGIGRRLVEHAVRVLQAEDVAAVTVRTAMADVDNIRFYQRCGFRATAIEPDAFTPATGYPPDLAADGIAVRDAIRFARVLDARALAADADDVAVRTGLMVALEAAPGRAEELAAFLRSALPLVDAEPETVAWLAIRIDASSYAIVDAFPTEAGRQAHLDGPVAAALMQRADELLAAPPEIRAVEVLAAKLPRR